MNQAQTQKTIDETSRRGDELLRIVGILQELTVAALDLFDPRTSADAFVERIAERLGCTAVLWIETDVARAEQSLLGAAGISRASRQLPLPRVGVVRPGADGDGARSAPPYMELARPDLSRWTFHVSAPSGMTIDSVLLLFFEGEPSFAGHYRRMLEQLTSVLRIALGHRHLYGQLIDSERLLLKQKLVEERDKRRAAFLADASRKLVGSIDYDATLVSIARLAVPYLADWCVCAIVEPSGGLRRLAGAHVDPSKADRLRELEPLGPDLDAPLGTAKALRSGEPTLCSVFPDSVAPTVEEAFRLFGATRPELQRVVLELGISSLMTTPLLASGKPVGSLLLVRTSGSRAYDGDDLALATELAERASLALDNARLYREAREAVRVREEFISVAAHELRTPLTALKLAIDHMARAVVTRPDPSRLAAMAAAASRQAQRLGALIEGLLEVSRIAAGRLSLTLQQVDLAEVAREVAGSFGDELARAHVQLEIRAPSAVVGRWDRSRLDQVLTNLLSNALKYGAGKPVEIEVSREDDRARLAVVDHGIGIPEDSLERVFERFERAVSARHYGGLGLGLYIVREVVHALGGTIHINSKVDEGSTVTIELPLEGPPNR